MKPSELKPTFCRNLLALRHAKQWSQRRLAIELKTSPSVIIDWEKGVTSPTLDSIAKICDVLCVEPLDLLSESTERILTLTS